MGENSRRRLSGGHITLIVVAVCAVLVPTVAYAAQRVISVIGDPHDSSALARVSQDGHLATRGDATAQQGVPSNEWHVSTSANVHRGTLLKAAPAGSGIGVSQVAIHWAQRGDYALVLLFSRQADEDGLCPERALFDTHDDVLQRAWFSTRGARSGGDQRVFPVPLTVPAARDRSVCLYGSGGVLVGPEAADFAGVQLDANGVSGPATPSFRPPKGNEPAPVPDPEVKPG